MNWGAAESYYPWSCNSMNNINIKSFWLEQNKSGFKCADSTFTHHNETTGKGDALVFEQRGIQGIQILQPEFVSCLRFLILLDMKLHPIWKLKSDR